MVFSITLNKKAEKKQSMVNVEEVYNLWDLTVVTYQAVDRGQLWLTYAHDPDLRLILKKAVNKAKKFAESLEKELKKYSIAGPTRPRASLNVSVNSEILLDEDIGGYLLLARQEEIELLFRAFRTATTNDAIRGLFVKFLTDAIDDLDILIKYLKLRGWLQISPMYPNIPAETAEKIDAGEAFHLWDHLTFRYDNIYQTQFWYEYAVDLDFKFILKQGLQETLEKQAVMLEQELNKFGIPLPKRPPGAVQAAADTSLMDDAYMFRLLFTGIIGAAWLHALALKQCVTNDRVRGIFRKLLVEEIHILDKMIMFGKIKGWFAIVPQFMTVM